MQWNTERRVSSAQNFLRVRQERKRVLHEQKTFEMRLLCVSLIESLIATFFLLTTLLQLEQRYAKPPGFSGRLEREASNASQLRTDFRTTGCQEVIFEFLKMTS